MRRIGNSLDVSLHDDTAEAAVAALSVVALVNIGTVGRGKLNNSFLLIVSMISLAHVHDVHGSD